MAKRPKLYSQELGSNNYCLVEVGIPGMPGRRGQAGTDRNHLRPKPVRGMQVNSSRTLRGPDASLGEGTVKFALFTQVLGSGPTYIAQGMSSLRKRNL